MPPSSEPNRQLASPTPVVLTIAGSDNSAGAGIQADLKAISSAGCYALTAVTCIVAEVPGRVLSIQTVTPSILADQILSCFEAFPIAAVKTGMLANRELAKTVADTLREQKKSSSFSLVVDPVMIASCGTPLLDNDAVKIYRDTLLPMASLVTPNLDELVFLSGQPVASHEDMETQGLALSKKFGIPVLCKGGHLKTAEAIDILVGEGFRAEFSAPFLKNAETHGTGCTYSASIAAWLAKGYPLQQSIEEAKKFITQALVRAHSWGNTRALRSI